MTAATKAHPRLQARRDEVERVAETVAWRRFSYLWIPLLVIAIGLGLARTDFVDVDAVEIRGLDTMAEDRVLVAAGVDPGTQLVDLDLDHIASRVERLPLVDRASVRRVWPDTVRITVVERLPVAAVQTAAGDWLTVDLDGRVLAAAETAPAGLPVVIAAEVDAIPGSAEARVVDAVQVIDALTPDLWEWVDTVEQSSDRSVVLHLAGGADVVIGDTRQLPDKLVALATVLTRVDPSCVAVIDVQAPRAPVVDRGC